LEVLKVVENGKKAFIEEALLYVAQSVDKGVVRTSLRRDANHEQVDIEYSCGYKKSVDITDAGTTGIILAVLEKLKG
jgi:hypothetical protein